MSGMFVMFLLGGCITPDAPGRVPDGWLDARIDALIAAMPDLMVEHWWAAGTAYGIALWHLARTGYLAFPESD